jgi:putative ABC transport system permease protein
MIAVIAIILTSILFTSVFTASSSVLKSLVESEMRIKMSKSHISVEELTKEQYELVSKDKAIKKYGLSIFLSFADNEELSEKYTEIRYADKNAAESFLCLPSTGRLPLKEDEIATSTMVLDLLKIKHQLGEKVKLTYTLNKKVISKEFTLCGYWEGDKIAKSQLAWVSKAYCDSVAPIAPAKQINKRNYEGDYKLSIWFDNSLSLEKKTKALEKRCNLKEVNARFSANPAYDLFVEDGFPFESVAIILGIIMLSGYLIIYNVFNISVNIDIRVYGLLKNIGTTGKQLKKIVRLQALWLSMIGIPLGMIFGFLIGRTMTPFLLANGEVGNKVQTSISYNPLVFIAAALFTLFTIYVGCLKPCHIVEKLSPVEAVRMTDAKFHKKTKKSGNVSAFSMAVLTAIRTRHKGIAVVISMALSLMILNMVYMIVNGFDFNVYTSTFISSDYEVNGFTSNLKNANLNIITPEFINTCNENKNIKSIGLVYYTQGSHKIDDILYKNLKEWIKKIGNDNFSDFDRSYMKKALKTREVQSEIIGINKAAFEKLEMGKRKCTWNEFSSGKYIITLNVSYGEFYSAGDNVNVEFSDTDRKEYQVLALGNLPYTLRYYYYTPLITQIFLLPEKEYIKETGNKNAMVAAIDITKGRTKAVSEWLNAYLQKHNSKYFIKSRYEIQKEFENFVNKYYVIGGSLTLVLFIIGILNFFNTSATSILSRKKELSLLEVVGMTKKQLLKMLIIEGVLYLGIAFALAATLGTMIATKLISISVEKVFFFRSSLSILPSIIAAPVLLFIIIVVPIYNYNKMSKETVVERIRNEG